MALRLAAAMTAALLLSGCSLSGACVSTGSRPEECKEGWDDADCKAFEQNKVNGATWTFYPGQDCGDRGFTAKCQYDPNSYCR